MSSPNNGKGGPDIPNAMTATALVSSMYCVGLQCNFKTGNMFLLLNSHFGDHEFHNNKEVEMAVGKLV